jgi:diguanylate cyclase (GGDEF)-like protein
MTPPAFPAIGLIGLLDTFALSSEEAIVQLVIDTAAENYEAEIVALVAGGEVIQATGIGGSAELEARLVEVALADTEAMSSSIGELGPLGKLQVATLPAGEEDSTRFVLARSSGGFDPDELRGCRAMIRIMRLAIRSIDTLDRQVQISERLSAQVEENQRLAAQLQHRHTELMSRMLTIQELLSSSSGSVLESIVEQGGALFDAAIVGLSLLRADGALELLHITPNAPTALVEAAKVVPPGVGVSHMAVERNELIVASDYHELTRPIGGLGALHPGAVISAPVRQRNEVVGALTIISLASDQTFSREETETALLLAGYASVALTDARTLSQRQRALEQAEWQATHDALTGLANRRLVLDSITDRLNNDEAFHVLYIDIDRFKAVNDLYGHHVGDLLICEVARRIEVSTRLDDLVGRLAGDEFIVVCGRDIDLQRARAIAERIRRKLSGPLSIDGRTVPLSVSIGIATSTDGSSADDVINAADVAMYQAKSGGRNQVGRYNEHLRTQLRQHAKLAERLETEVASCQRFRLAYQPIVEIATGAVVGHEALIRWEDEVLGPIEPNVFIPRAEELGLIAKIDGWVIDTALREASAAGLHGSLSVNVSSAWLASGDPARKLVGLAAAHGFPLERLSIEVTERVAMAAQVTTALADLRQLGIGVLLDDFGTGYSSLAYIHMLEIDGIKIDRGFLQGVESNRHTAAILEAVVTLTDRLGAVAIAEGVESLAQAEVLTALGCRLAQGYYFGRPAPASSLTTPTGIPAAVPGHLTQRGRSRP